MIFFFYALVYFSAKNARFWRALLALSSLLEDAVLLAGLLEDDILFAGLL